MKKEKKKVWGDKSEGPEFSEYFSLKKKKKARQNKQNDYFIHSCEFRLDYVWTRKTKTTKRFCFCCSQEDWKPPKRRWPLRWDEPVLSQQSLFTSSGWQHFARRIFSPRLCHKAQQEGGGGRGGSRMSTQFAISDVVDGDSVQGEGPTEDVLVVSSESVADSSLIVLPPRRRPPANDCFSFSFIFF